MDPSLASLSACGGQLPRTHAALEKAFSLLQRTLTQHRTTSLLCAYYRTWQHYVSSRRALSQASRTPQRPTTETLTSPQDTSCPLFGSPCSPSQVLLSSSGRRGRRRVTVHSPKSGGSGSANPSSSRRREEEDNFGEYPVDARDTSLTGQSSNPHVEWTLAHEVGVVRTISSVSPVNPRLLYLCEAAERAEAERKKAIIEMLGDASPLITGGRAAAAHPPFGNLQRPRANSNGRHTKSFSLKKYVKRKLSSNKSGGAEEPAPLGGGHPSLVDTATYIPVRSLTDSLSASPHRLKQAKSTWASPSRHRLRCKGKPAGAATPFL